MTRIPRRAWLMVPAVYIQIAPLKRLIRVHRINDRIYVQVRGRH